MRTQNNKAKDKHALNCYQVTNRVIFSQYHNQCSHSKISHHNKKQIANIICCHFQIAEILEVKNYRNIYIQTQNNKYSKNIKKSIRIFLNITLTINNKIQTIVHRIKMNIKI